MLEQIINSKTDSAALGFFLSSPGRCFSILEVSKRLRMSKHASVHSLNNLAAEGILKSFSKRGKKYYILNHKFKLLQDILSFWSKESSVYPDELFSAIKKLGDIKAAFLSGIFTANPGLPVDILLVGKVNLNRLSGFLKSVEKLMGQEINYSIMSVEEFLLRRDTFDKFIKDIFDYRHLTVLNTIGKKKSRRPA